MTSRSWKEKIPENAWNLFSLLSYSSIVVKTQHQLIHFHQCNFSVNAPPQTLVPRLQLLQSLLNVFRLIP
jgi:hypothetical protein